VDKLNIQLFALESEQEQLHASMKKQRKMDASKSERLTMLDHRMERHKFHINNLELILRLLDNNSVTVEQVNQIKDDINYYIDENHDDDFQDDDEIYAELNLEEMGGFGAFGDHSDEEEGIFNWNSCGRNASTK
jgi:CCR4-NOT transcription complex subunit 3